MKSSAYSWCRPAALGFAAVSLLAGCGSSTESGGHGGATSSSAASSGDTGTGGSGGAMGSTQAATSSATSGTGGAKMEGPCGADLSCCALNQMDGVVPAWIGSACVLAETCPDPNSIEVPNAPAGSPPANTTKTGCSAGLVCNERADGNYCGYPDAQNGSFPNCTADCVAPYFCNGAIGKCVRSCNLPTCAKGMTLYQAWNNGGLEQLCVKKCP
jgi:hypothetical protein